MKEKADHASATSEATEERAHCLPPMDFSTFVLSLSSSAMVNLGQVPAPGETSTTPKNLPAAKQIIDILAVLEEKTSGNLDESEASLLSSLLYDLRVHYVDAQKD